MMFLLISFKLNQVYHSHIVLNNHQYEQLKCVSISHKVIQHQKSLILPKWHKLKEKSFKWIFLHISNRLLQFVLYSKILLKTCLNGYKKQQVTYDTHLHLYYPTLFRIQDTILDLYYSLEYLQSLLLKASKTLE